MDKRDIGLGVFGLIGIAYVVSNGMLLSDYMKKRKHKNAETFDAELKKDSCCCGATVENPCLCMEEGVMNCSAVEPKCPCYAAKDAESFSAEVIACDYCEKTEGGLYSTVSLYKCKEGCDVCSECLGDNAYMEVDPYMEECCYEHFNKKQPKYAESFEAERGREGKRVFVVSSVDYETDGEDVDLPQNFTFILDEHDTALLDGSKDMQEIADLLVDNISDETGWLVQGFYSQERMPDGTLVDLDAESFEAQTWKIKCDICGKKPIYDTVDSEDYGKEIQVCENCFNDIFTAESFGADEDFEEKYEGLLGEDGYIDFDGIKRCIEEREEMKELLYDAIPYIGTPDMDTTTEHARGLVERINQWGAESFEAEEFGAEGTDVMMGVRLNVGEGFQDYDQVYRFCNEHLRGKKEEDGKTLWVEKFFYLDDYDAEEFEAEDTPICYCKSGTGRKMVLIETKIEDDEYGEMYRGYSVREEEWKCPSCKKSKWIGPIFRAESFEAEDIDDYIERIFTFIDEKVGTEYFGSIEDEEEVIRFKQAFMDEFNEIEEPPIIDWNEILSAESFEAPGEMEEEDFIPMDITQCHVCARPYEYSRIARALVQHYLKESDDGTKGWKNKSTPDGTRRTARNIAGYQLYWYGLGALENYLEEGKISKMTPMVIDLLRTAIVPNIIAGDVVQFIESMEIDDIEDTDPTFFTDFSDTWEAPDDRLRPERPSDDTGDRSKYRKKPRKPWRAENQPSE